MSHYRHRNNDQDIDNKQNVVIEVINTGDNNQFNIVGAVAQNANSSGGWRQSWHQHNHC